MLRLLFQTVQNHNQNVFFSLNMLLCNKASHYFWVICNHITVFHNSPVLQMHKCTTVHRHTNTKARWKTYTHPCPLGTRVQTSLHRRAGPIFHQGGRSKLKPQGHAISFPSQGSRGRGGHCLLDTKSPRSPSGQEGVGSLLDLKPVKVI